MEKFEIQNNEYSFPYHYLPEYDKNTGFKKKKQLLWGGEYLSYMRFVSDQVINCKPQKVLDVGCGDGRLCNIIKASDSSINIKGIDLSEKAIRWAKMFNENIDFAVMDVSNIKEKYEAITVVEVIEHIPEEQLDTFFRALSNALQANGTIYITVPADNVPVSKKHYRHYNFNMLEEQLKRSNSGLVIVREDYIVPSATKIYPFLMRLSSNRLWDLHFIDKLCWKILWKNGLIATCKNGSHCYFELKHM